MSRRYFTSCTECGWRSKPTGSQARADYAHRRHSCDKQRDAVAALARGLARHAAVDRTPKPCLHKYARHEHGTHACYVLDRCKCMPCTCANSDYETQRSRNLAYGRASYVDAGPARRHVHDLMAAGIGLKQIAKVSGVAHGALWKLIYGKTRPDGSRQPTVRVKPETERALLGVTPAVGSFAGGARIDATGTHRRVQALVAVGWSQSKIAERIGVHRANFTTMMQAAEVTARTARTVAALYEDLWDKAPPHAAHRDKIAYSRSVKFARDRHWAPPLAWDDESIDKPDATPDLGDVATGDVELDEIAIYRIMDGSLLPRSIDERVEAMRRLATAGLNDRDIGARVGLAASSVATLRARYGITRTVGA